MKNKKKGNNWTAYYDPDTKRYTKNRSIWSICLGKAQLCIAPNVEKRIMMMHYFALPVAIK